MDLNNAEIAVTTQHLIDIKDYRDYWLYLSDYSDMGEFLSACSDLFPGEKEPEYRYPKWENIPDTLISREWLCPNFFEIRDALERLEEEETEFFISWSRSYGYDITTDDPHMMVSHYHDLYGDTVTETEDDTDTGEDVLIYTGISSYYCDTLPFRYEIFDDNYNYNAHRPILAAGIRGDTEHHTDSRTHRGRKPLPHKQERQSAVRLAVRLFQMVVRRRPFHPLATHGLQFNAVFQSQDTRSAIRYPGGERQRERL